MKQTIKCAKKDKLNVIKAYFFLFLFILFVLGCIGLGGYYLVQWWMHCGSVGDCVKEAFILFFFW